VRRPGQSTNHSERYPSTSITVTDLEPQSEIERMGEASAHTICAQATPTRNLILLLNLVKHRPVFMRTLATV
jgi:hypothetical protein